MAGVKDFMNHRYPTVPRQWECEKYDLPCLYLARQQEHRQFLILQEKTQMLKQRFGQCVRIHENNRHLFCREELVRYHDAYNKLQMTGLQGYNHNTHANEVGPLHAGRAGIRPDAYFLRPGDTNYSVPPAQQSGKVQQRPQVVHAVHGEVEPDPNRPVVGFEKRGEELRVSIHLPEEMPREAPPEMKTAFESGDL